ncbi:hypothetical protein C0Q57_06555 [Streptomyces albidoflavus]|nr:hypothetical protein C0Q57_06555 [Streptomyces albidoflavus]
MKPQVARPVAAPYAARPVAARVSPTPRRHPLPPRVGTWAPPPDRNGPPPPHPLRGRRAVPLVRSDRSDRHQALPRPGAGAGAGVQPSGCIHP